MPTLKNWNDTIIYNVNPELYKTPSNVAEVQEIVRGAYEKHIPVTVVGSCHSTTACMVGSAINLSMTNFDRIISVSRKALRTRVQAGVTLSQLGSYLRDLDLQPPVILEWGNYHIGAISGTHANDTTTRRPAQFSSYVLGLKLVTPKGELMEISQHKNSEYLPAIRSHFGMFGVVYEVTLAVRENRPLSICFVKMDLTHFLDNFEQEIQAIKVTYDEAFGLLCPQSNRLYWQGRSYIKSKTSRGPFSALKNHLGAKNRTFNLAMTFVKAFSRAKCPAGRARILNFIFILFPLFVLRHAPYIINPCDRGKLYAEDDVHLDFYDWVFPEDQWAGMATAYLQLTETFRQQHNFGLPMPALIYMIPKDEASLLSRSRHANMMAIDPICLNPQDPKWKVFRMEFNKIAITHNGVPHVNKTRDGAVYHLGKALDSTAVECFLKQRAQFDPKNLFLNDHYREMFVEYL